MQFSIKLSVLFVALVQGVANAAPHGPEYIVSDAEMDHWLATTDAELTYIGKNYNSLSPREAQDTRVVYCNRRNFNVCGGSCTVYNGGAACLNAPGTQCLFATRNVGFCDRSGCRGSCNQFSTCGTRMDNGFCWTPGTASITVPPS